MHSCVWLFATLWTVANEAPLSMGFFRQEYWSGLTFPPPGDLPNSGIEPKPPTLQADSLPAKSQRKPENTGVGCHFLLQCMKVKSEGEVAQSCPTLCDPTDCMQPTRLLHPWDFPGKSTGVGCHGLLLLNTWVYPKKGERWYEWVHPDLELLIYITCKLRQNTLSDGNWPKLFYELSIIWISKSEKEVQEGIITDLFYLWM